jgi:hypothetical protein
MLGLRSAMASLALEDDFLKVIESEALDFSADKSHQIYHTTIWIFLGTEDLSMTVILSLKMKAIPLPFRLSFYQHYRLLCKERG